MNHYFEQLGEVDIPGGWYFDARIEEVSKFILRYENGQLLDERHRSERGAFLRLGTGKMWYTSGFSGTGQLAEKVSELLCMARKDSADESGGFDNGDMFKAFEVNVDESFEYASTNISRIPADEKKVEIESALSAIGKQSGVLKSEVFYSDSYVVKHFFSSKGARLSFDKQYAGIHAGVDFECDNENMKVFQDAYSYTDDSFGGLMDKLGRLEGALQESAAYSDAATPLEAGEYEVILSPQATGIFAHESFGHKAEADFYSDPDEIERMREVGFSGVLSIVDDNSIRGYGYTPYDDDGSRGKRSFIVRDGRFEGALQSAETASRFSASSTGNARAVGYLHEPIVRMTNTIILPGESRLEDMIASIDRGILVGNIRHGFGMSDFTLAPVKCHMIEGGKVTRPVIVSVLSGNVDATLGKVSMLSDEIEVFSFAKGGCGKLDQFPLEVGFGGPYMKIDSMEAM